MKVLKRKILWSFALKLKLFLILFLIVCFNCKRYLSNWSDQKILLLPPVAFFPSFQYHITAFCINSTRSRSIARGKYHGLFLSFRRRKLHRLYSSVRPDKLDMRKNHFSLCTLIAWQHETWQNNKKNYADTMAPSVMDGCELVQFYLKVKWIMIILSHNKMNFRPETHLLYVVLRIIFVSSSGVLLTCHCSIVSRKKP